MLLWLVVRAEGMWSHDDGVWWDESVVRVERPESGLRIYHFTNNEDRFRVLVASVAESFHADAKRHVHDCDASQWQPMSSFVSDTVEATQKRSAPAAYSCLHPRPLADALLEKFNGEASLARAMKLAFNVSEPCVHREGKVDPKLGGSWLNNHVLYHFSRAYRGTRSWTQK